jgi:ribosomal protein L33
MRNDCKHKNIILLCEDCKTTLAKVDDNMRKIAERLEHGKH